MEKYTKRQVINDIVRMGLEFNSYSVVHSDTKCSSFFHENINLGFTRAKAMRKQFSELAKIAMKLFYEIVELMGEEHFSKITFNNNFYNNYVNRGKKHDN